MKILWVINIPLPEASLLLNQAPLPIGGWLINSANNLSTKIDIDLSIAFPDEKTSNYTKIIGKNIKYYAFKPVGDKDKETIENNKIFEEIINEVKPDIVHVYGTELPHTLSMINLCNKLNIKAVISIQGLVSIISKHMNANLPFTVIYGFTLRNLLRRDNVKGLQILYNKRGKNEIEAIKKTKFIIGRTTWDRACVSLINSDALYFSCNETLREEFYKHEWDINTCEKHTILISQAHYPIKGLHYLINALPLIIKKFPDTKIYVSGKNFIKTDNLYDKLIMTYYGKYIKKKIKDLNIESNVEFTGLLNEEQMCYRFLKSHLFVCASTIENESNSLSEAKILGVPSIASYVGGVVDRVKHNEDGFLYQHDATYMLAYYVCKIFEDNELAMKISKEARKNALQLHNVNKNTEKLIDIYNEILQQ